MGWVKQYILSVVAAAIICAIIKTLADGKSTPSYIIKLLAGLFVALTVIAPVAKLELRDITDYVQNFQISADAAVQSGISYSVTELSAIIKGRTQAYILDKAQSLGAEIVADVHLNDDLPPVPCTVTLTGQVSPYVKERLTQYIADDLGIAEENQEWN